MKRAAPPLCRGAAVAAGGQRRHYWFDRFIRNTLYGAGTPYRSLQGRNKNAQPGRSEKHSVGDVYFGYIPNYYEMEDRAMFDRKTLEVDRIRPPCGEIPDVETFLERAHAKAELTEYADKFEGWDDMMRCSFMEMVYKKSIPQQHARAIYTARELYNNGHILHYRNASDWKDWGKNRGMMAPFPENYYPHMRIAKYRELIQEAQTTGHKMATWEAVRAASRGGDTKRV
eukprot:TRINITY_DN8060_c0_g2_i1.p2 TRINITY_DN8060_c0_g2~~TRINITY_DN8060_c0_g2_i1.p2  ORF type:complete len:228 (+),score=71.70 TRINITY_DN8060_c0_g2_i1:63-746(+)